MEEWRACVGFEGFYEVSNLGNVRTIPRMVNGQWGEGTYPVKEKIRKNYIGSDGYVYVGFYINNTCKMQKVHRLVANAFIPNLNNKPMVNHIDGIKHNNRVENLEWCTAQENSDHAWKMGLKKGQKWSGFNFGERCYMSKLKEKDVLEIRKMWDGGQIGKKNIRKFALLYGVSSSAIEHIVRRRSWRHLP